MFKLRISKNGHVFSWANIIKLLRLVRADFECMEKVKYAYVFTGEYPLFIMVKWLIHQDSMGLIEILRNFLRVEEVKTELKKFYGSIRNSILIKL